MIVKGILNLNEKNDKVLFTNEFLWLKRNKYYSYLNWWKKWMH